MHFLFSRLSTPTCWFLGLFSKLSEKSNQSNLAIDENVAFSLHPLKICAIFSGPCYLFSLRKTAFFIIFHIFLKTSVYMGAIVCPRLTHPLIQTGQDLRLQYKKYLWMGPAIVRRSVNCAGLDSQAMPGSLKSVLHQEDTQKHAFEK